MKAINYKKGKKEKIFEILDKWGFITDKEGYKILGDTFYNLGEYIRMWKRLKEDREFFKDKEIIRKEKGHRMHLVQVKHKEQKELDNKFYKVGKDFYNEIKIK